MSESPSSPPGEQRGRSSTSDTPLTVESSQHPVDQAPHHLLEQAPVPPMDVDGLNVTILGLVAFAIGTVICLIFYSELQQGGKEWWLGVCISGVLLGGIGMAYCLTRRARRQAGHWDRD